MKVIVADTVQKASAHVADEIVQLLRQKPNALLGLGTGGTVEELYRQLVKANQNGGVDFSQARSVNLDEYVGLGVEDTQSFAYFMEKNLFSQTNFSRDNVYLMDGSAQPGAELERLDSFLAQHSVDYQLLGVGTNGHIGFNEPAAVFQAKPSQVRLAEETIQANARFFHSRDDVPQHAITVGMRDIVRAERVVLMAFGVGKAAVIKRLLANSIVDPQLPCSIIKLCSNATVVVDRELAQAAGVEG